MPVFDFAPVRNVAPVRYMGENGVRLGRFFRRAAGTVLAATGNRQEPFAYGRLPAGQFYFKPQRRFSLQPAVRRKRAP